MDTRMMVPVVSVMFVIPSSLAMEEILPRPQCPSQSVWMTLDHAVTAGGEQVTIVPCVPSSEGCKTQIFSVSTCSDDADEGVCKAFRRDNRVGLRCQTSHTLVYAYTKTQTGRVDWTLVKIPAGCQCLFCHITSDTSTFTRALGLDWD